MRPKSPPLDMSGLSDEERVDLSVQVRALATKVGDAKARAWGHGRIDEILRGRDGNA